MSANDSIVWIAVGVNYLFISCMFASL